MNTILIERWNAVVRPRDVVWHLGDFSLGPKGTANRFFSDMQGYAPVAAEDIIATAKSRVSLGSERYGTTVEGMQGRS